MKKTSTVDEAFSPEADDTDEAYLCLVAKNLGQTDLQVAPET